MSSLWNDLRYALRRLTKSPGFTAAALVTLALGIGANTAIFTVVNAVMLRPLPVVAPERLVEIYTSDADGTPATSSYPDYVDYRDQAVSLGGRVTAFNATLLTRSEQGRSEILFGEAVSGNFFEVLGLGTRLGRAITPEDDRPGQPHVAVLGHGFWQRRFGADPSVIGRTLTISGQPITVVGVMNDRYKGSIVGLEADMWVPMHTDFALTPSR
ncbi:MAG: ABC transporter permease, partial [Vicinamibacteria bacterium]